MKKRTLRKAYEYAIWYYWDERDRGEAEELAELMKEYLDWRKMKKYSGCKKKK